MRCRWQCSHGVQPMAQHGLEALGGAHLQARGNPLLGQDRGRGRPGPFMNWPDTSFVLAFPVRQVKLSPYDGNSEVGLAGGGFVVLVRRLLRGGQLPTWHRGRLGTVL